MYREAASLQIELDGVRVTARGDFDTETWASTGIEYSIDVSSQASAEEVERLLAVVDEVAEIPRAIRNGAAVTRIA